MGRFSTPIVEMDFGSRVYGTSVPESDTDIKFVFQPPAREILLGRQSDVVYMTTKKDKSAKNSKDDIDREGFSIQQFLKLAAEGQTLALDMLFTPKEFWRYQTPAWESLINNRHQLVSKKMQAFVGYCRAQFTKYCVKAERLRAVEDMRLTLEQLTQRDKVGDVIPHITPLTIKHPGIIIVNENTGHIECCGRAAPFGATVKLAREIYDRVYEKYGNRTKAAVEGGCVEWKSLYHAVRIAKEAEELLLTGHITLPRPEAKLLLDIRNQKISFEEIQELIEEGLNRVEAAVLKSTLPESPNQVWIDNFIIDQNLAEISRYH
jgi:hypothetical protein